MEVDEYKEGDKFTTMYNLRKATEYKTEDKKADDDRERFLVKIEKFILHLIDEEETEEEEDRPLKKRKIVPFKGFLDGEVVEIEE